MTGIARCNNHVPAWSRAAAGPAMIRIEKESFRQFDPVFNLASRHATCPERVHGRAATRKVVLCA
jgi:hypothetical protein